MYTTLFRHTQGMSTRGMTLYILVEQNIQGFVCGNCLHFMRPNAKDLICNSELKL